SWLDDVELLVQRRRTTNAELGVTYRQLFGDATLDMEAGIRKGVSWFNAQDDLPAQEGVPTLRPRIVTLSAGYVQPFHIGKQPFRYSGTVRAQFTRDTTLSIDQMAIGSRYTVRGFDGDNVLLAENGYVIRNEWLMPVRIGVLPDGFDSALYLGLDAGRVWGRSDAMLAGRWLAGAALGLRTGWRGWQADIAIAAPLYYPKGFRTRGWSPYLSLTYGF
ncbi:ShlB/FhaC/HecB family hemolysin secretion/activation protein, partial [Imbroritus primus]